MEEEKNYFSVPFSKGLHLQPSTRLALYFQDLYQNEGIQFSMSYRSKKKVIRGVYDILELCVPQGGKVYIDVIEGENREQILSDAFRFIEEEVLT